MEREKLIEYFDKNADTRRQWKRKNWYYHRTLERLIQFLIPAGQQVLEIGAGTGELLAAAKPKDGTGIDISSRMIEHAREAYPHYTWQVDDIEHLKLDKVYDYVVLSDVLGYVGDVELSFSNLQKISHHRTKVVITSYNYLWEPLFRFAELLHLKERQPLQNWLAPKDIENFLYLAGFEVIKRGNKMIFPRYIPLVSSIINLFLANLPLVNKLGIIHYVVARRIPREEAEYSVSVVIPCRNEEGNIENAVRRMPFFGSSVEIIFSYDRGSTDNTRLELQRVAKAYEHKRDVQWFDGGYNCKWDTVRVGFEHATGDILMILDGDLTVVPEDLPKFYRAIASGKGEFINGSRLVYQLEAQSMRMFNIVGNKFFSVMFTWLLGQRIKDTLCGTKVLFKKDYKVLDENRKYFGEFDQYGDFDLLFGASKLNLKIVEVPVRYGARTYGSSNMRRWKHGILFLRMTLFAMRKIKFI